MTETQTTLASADLVVGTRYRVAFTDCCVRGYFIGRFIEVRIVEVADEDGGPYEDAIVFDTGEIEPMQWGQYMITRT